jgi:hypothetical protein
MARTDRIAACRAAEDDLAQRIEEYRPEAVVTLLMSIRDISGQQQARLETSLRYTLVPFPGIPLSGDEIGRLMAQALEGGAIEKRPWYQPADGVPEEAVIKHTSEMEFDSLVVDVPPGPKAPALRAVPTGDKQQT